MPTRPLWPMKNSQSARPAALAIAFTRRAICDSDHPNTFSLPSTPAGRMAFRASMAAGVMATTVPWASASVLERTHGDAAALDRRLMYLEDASPDVTDGAVCADAGVGHQSAGVFNGEYRLVDLASAVQWMVKRRTGRWSFCASISVFGARWRM